MVLRGRERRIRASLHAWPPQNEELEAEKEKKVRINSSLQARGYDVRSDACYASRWASVVQVQRPRDIEFSVLHIQQLQRRRRRRGGGGSGRREENGAKKKVKKVAEPGWSCRKEAIKMQDLNRTKASWVINLAEPVKKP